MDPRRHRPRSSSVAMRDGHLYPHSFTLADLGYVEHFIRLHHGTKTMAFFDADPGCIWLRHDIDHDMQQALRLAQWEAKRGFAATYFVLPTANYFRNDYTWTRTLALEIQALGHEVGVHNDALVACGGDVEASLILLKRWGDEMRGWGIDVQGVADHGGSVYDNTDIWRKHGHRPEEAGYRYEAYLLGRQQPTNYISDNRGMLRAPLERDGRPTIILMHPVHWQLPEEQEKKE